MGRLTNSNMITYYTVMSKNTGLENLADEFAAMPNALKSMESCQSNRAIVLARMIRGVSCEDWEQASESYPLSEWHAMSVAPDASTFSHLNAGDGKSFTISPFRDAACALTTDAFVKLLARELLRLGRNGGSLSLVSAGVAEKRRLVTALGEITVNRLEATLGAILLSQLEACDSLGILRPSQYICCLPGIGQLVARRFAEKARNAFVEAARPFFPTGGITGGQSADCAIGIVNILQGESGSAQELFNRSKTSLEVALSKDGGHIHQETSISPIEGTTLVHSSEKRFLFFGSDTP